LQISFRQARRENVSSGREREEIAGKVGDKLERGILHPKGLQQFLNMVRRPIFENASMLLLFEAMEFLPNEYVDDLLRKREK